jgi:hypothetical protein
MKHLKSFQDLNEDSFVPKNELNIWDESNLRAIGAKKDKKEYVISVEKPFTVKIDDQEKFFNFRSVLIRNDIPFTTLE